MQKHTKNYIDFHNIGEQDIIRCEVCGKIAVDIHHIKYKSQGGSDEIDNLIGLCRQCHELAHTKKLTEKELYVRNTNTKSNS